MRKSFKTKWKQGWRTIGGVKKYYRSRWEANYARYLDEQKKDGYIQKWEHEPETFWFLEIKRGTRSYLPDFRVTNNDGTIEYHEVKGWLTPKCKTKLKRMKKYHPDIKIILIDKKPYTIIERKHKRNIAEWE